MGSFDVYVQYSICEGFGMPQVEAGGCGIPIMTVNYSAMEDIIQKLDATPIDIGASFKELETSAIRVYPKQEDFVQKLLDLINRPEQMRKRLGFSVRQKTEQHYNWQSTIDKWTKYLDSVVLTEYQGRWDTPQLPISPINPNAIPAHDNIYELVYMLNRDHISKLNMPISNYWLLKQIQTAQEGYAFVGPEAKPFSTADLISNLNQLIENHNIAEVARTNPAVLEKEDYIEYANK
jgi:hypothetical protein